MNFECDGKIYSIPMAKPSESGPQYSLEEYEIAGEDRAFLFLDSEDTPYLPLREDGGLQIRPADMPRMCIALDDVAIRLWRMATDAGVATKQLYRAEDFEPGGFMQVTLEYAREVDRVRAMDLERATEITRGKTREQLEAEEALGSGKGLITTASGRPS